MVDLNPNRKKGRFEGWTSADWALAIIFYIVGSLIFGLLKMWLGLSKDWTLVFILIPIAIIGYFQNKIKKRLSS